MLHHLEHVTERIAIFQRARTQAHIGRLGHTPARLRSLRIKGDRTGCGRNDLRGTCTTCTTGTDRTRLAHLSSGYLWV